MSMSNNEIKICKSCGYQGVMLGDDCDKCGSLWIDVVENKTMKFNEFEQHIENLGLVEFAGWYFKKDECGEYLHEPTRIASDIWEFKQKEIYQLKAEINLLKEALDIKEKLNEKLRSANTEREQRIEKFTEAISVGIANADAEVITQTT